MALTEGVYGSPPPALVASSAGARQFSPLAPGAESLEETREASLSRLVVSAPPGVLERRFALAQALRILAPGGELIALAPKRLGGARLARELAGFGCAVVESARRHYRLCACRRPEVPIGLEAAIEEGAQHWSPNLGAWTQPGVFSWDRADPGSGLLIASLPALAGDGADLGCGIGLIARAALASPAVRRLVLIDIDGRAIAAARRNLDDPRASFLHADLPRTPQPRAQLDFVVMNPPFHRDGRADIALGQAFIAAAAAMLKPGGVCRMVANQALPYETTLRQCFSQVTPLDRSGGYKLHEARR